MRTGLRLYCLLLSVEMALAEAAGDDENVDACMDAKEMLLAIATSIDALAVVTLHS